MSLCRVLSTLIFLLFTLDATLTYSSQNASCNTKDLSGLQGFLDGLSTVNLNWNLASTNCCDWYGVSCTQSPDLGLRSSNLSGQRVVILDLGSKKLQGMVLKHLAVLDQLEVLNLSSNALFGGLPLELLQLQHLKVLDLSGNKFSGSIPQISNLPSIEVFDISNNLFSGYHPIFPADQSQNLTDLVISMNLFTGPINATSLCTSLPQVRVLDLSSNLFSGDLPSGFGHCKSMAKLFLHSNNLSGNLPGDFFELSSLMQLDLHGNKFSGQLDDRIKNLTFLSYLDISNNGFYRGIPEVFNIFKDLIHFSASSNNFSGNLPRTLASATMLGHLDLRNNSMQGSIEINCTSLYDLNFLDLGFNQFTGVIPDNLSLCFSLKFLNLDKNKLEGVIPDSLKNLTRLSYLSLSNNDFRNISRALDVLQQCESLTTVVLAGNFKGEEMPTKQIQGFNYLEVLSMPNCSLHGYIPPWLSNCTRLKVLDLSRNQLTGAIPPILGNLMSLSYLNLSHNQLVGQIPTNITIHSQQAQHPSDQVMKLVVVRAPNLVPQKTEDLGYNQFFTLPPTIDLSNNQLSGPITAQLGELGDLAILDLSGNHLSDAIPESFSNLMNLEILDLSNNNLTGRIPNSLVELSYLSRFNVSNNHLEGEIPTGGQFSTFPSSSFGGNLGLCGVYYLPCKIGLSNPGNSPDNEAKLRFDASAFGVGAAMGFVVTAIVCALSGFCHGREELMIKTKLTAFCSYLASWLNRFGSANGRGTSTSMSSS